MENKEKRKTYHNKVKEVSTCSEVCRQIVWKSADCSSPSPGLERGEERRGCIRSRSRSLRALTNEMPLSLPRGHQSTVYYTPTPPILFVLPKYNDGIGNWKEENGDVVVVVISLELQTTHQFLQSRRRPLLGPSPG